MHHKNYKVTVHMVSSVDGYVAKRDNSVSWFETKDEYEQGLAEELQEESSSGADCYVMGSKTYEHALELSAEYGWVYGDKPVIVVTRRSLSSANENVQFFNGSPEKLLREKLSPLYKNIWVVGGPELIAGFLKQGLADEIRINILPVLLGDGLRFFQEHEQEQKLHLKESKAYRNGMLELCYEIR